MMALINGMLVLHILIVPVSSFMHTSTNSMSSFRHNLLNQEPQRTRTYEHAVQKILSRKRRTCLKSLEKETEKNLSYIPKDIQISIQTNGHKYHCKQCAVGFKKLKNFQEHLIGKKHIRVESEWASAKGDYISDAPTWSNNDNVVDDDGNDNIDVCTLWRESEISTFPHRFSCIDPSVKISNLSPQLRARFWRYLRDSFGKHYPELAPILHHVYITFPQYLRVKELFESLESFRIVSSIIVMAQEAAKSAGSESKGSSSSSSKENIETIYDLACGHGLVGILLAYRFPTKKVVCVDLEERESFHAFKAAFNELGESYMGAIPLSNLEYRGANLLTVESELTESSFLVALHACNEANKDVVDMARGADAAWAVMPCCIRSKLYLGGAPVLDLDSESRYKVLCGAFAEANDAQMIRSISRNITARPILIAGGFPGEFLNNDSRSSTSNTPNRHGLLSL
jgi:hypothetical protein